MLFIVVDKIYLGLQIRHLMEKREGKEMVKHIEELVTRINNAWVEGHPEDMESLLHTDIMMVLPGFSGRIRGKEAMLEGFTDFCNNAHVLKFKPGAIDIDVIGKTAVATFSFTLEYERNGKQYESAGRDLWLFAQEDDIWKAIWRTMLDLKDTEK